MSSTGIYSPKIFCCRAIESRLLTSAGVSNLIPGGRPCVALWITWRLRLCWGRVMTVRLISGRLGFWPISWQSADLHLKQAHARTPIVVFCRTKWCSQPTYRTIWEVSFERSCRNSQESGLKSIRSWRCPLSICIVIGHLSCPIDHAVWMIFLLPLSNVYLILYPIRNEYEMKCPRCNHLALVG